MPLHKRNLFPETKRYPTPSHPNYMDVIRHNLLFFAPFIAVNDIWSPVNYVKDRKKRGHHIHQDSKSEARYTQQTRGLEEEVPPGERLNYSILGYRRTTGYSPESHIRRSHSVSLLHSDRDTSTRLVRGLSSIPQTLIYHKARLIRRYIPDFRFAIYRPRGEGQVHGNYADVHLLPFFPV